ncbi:MAG: zeta toxin family protein [Chthoniobacteraceae bacterium]
MPDDKPVLVVIAGPNGSGKTEITKILRSRYAWTEGLVEINPDNIAQEKFGGWNDPDAVIKAANLAEEMREECLTKGQGLLFETVLSIPEKVDYICRAKEAGYFVRFVYVATNSFEINSSRVAWRVELGGHDVPLDKIRSRYVRSLKQAVNAARIADRAYFLDNSPDAEDSDKINPLTIFRTVDGVVVKTYINEKDFPLWTREIYKALQPSEK